MISVARLACVGTVMAVSLPAHAQSLAEVARQEELRRASAPKAVKTLSNADLRPSDVSVPAGAAAGESCYMSKSLGRCVEPEDLVSLSIAGATKKNAPFEDQWRQDAQSLRSLIDAARGRSAVLVATAADDRRSPGERKVAEKAMQTAGEAITSLERRWQKLEFNAALQQIPHAWLEPVPVFTIPAPQ